MRLRSEYVETLAVHIDTSFTVSGRYMGFYCSVEMDDIGVRRRTVYGFVISDGRMALTKGGATLHWTELSCLESTVKI